MFPELTEQQAAELTRLKQFYPFRIVFGAVHKTTGESITSTACTIRTPNRYARAGWKVFLADNKKT